MIFDGQFWEVAVTSNCKKKKRKKKRESRKKERKRKEKKIKKRVSYRSPPTGTLANCANFNTHSQSEIWFLRQLLILNFTDLSAENGN